ncbi:MAG TPA: hypothetical protein VGA99_04260 [bacterium]
MKEIYDFCIASDFEYDADFINIFEEAAREQRLTTFVVWPYNLNETLRRLRRDELGFQFFYDRASDSSPGFLKLNNFLVEHQVPLLDPIAQLQRASDKATMHLEFIANGLMTPYTIIIPPYDTLENIYLSVSDLAKLGRAFFIKPANTTGGGIGVVSGAESLQDVLSARKKFQGDKYLLQEKVEPQEKDGRRFWFRGFYVCGRVEFTWWNDLSHVYEVLEKQHIRDFKLQPLFRVVKKIAEISGLQFFSTEIALNREGKFIIVDYVNEICDMRLKSLHFDGVPDDIVHKVARRIVVHVKKKIQVERPAPR